LFYENKLNRFAEIGHCTMTQFLLQNCIATFVEKHLNPAIIMITFNVNSSLMTKCH